MTALFKFLDTNYKSRFIEIESKNLKKYMPELSLEQCIKETEKWWEEIKKNLNEVKDFKEDYQKNGNPEVIIETTNKLTFFYDLIFEQDNSWFYEAIENQYKGKSDSYYSEKCIAELFFTLKFYGCSANQAQESIGEWLLLSKSTIKNYCKKHCAESLHISSLISLDYKEKFAKPFPQHYQMAYQALSRAMLDYLIHRIAIYNTFSMPESERKIKIAKIYQNLRNFSFNEIDNLCVPGNKLLQSHYRTIKIILGIDNISELKFSMHDYKTPSQIDFT